MIISLTGFMGCGKSSVGKTLRTLLSCNLLDLDTYIEEKAGKTIPEIFKEEGEPAFRQMELDSLKEICDNAKEDEDIILSLGGGAVMTPECAAIVHEKTACVYLRATIDTLVSTLTGYESGRPMLSGATDLRTRIEELMQKRAAVYEQTAHYIVDIDGISYEDTSKEIASLTGRLIK